MRNRSYLRRFADCEFAQFFSICFSGSGECGHNSAAFWSIIPENQRRKRRSTIVQARWRHARFLPAMAHAFSHYSDSVTTLTCKTVTGTSPYPMRTPLFPVGRRSRPFQRGVRECQAWNERIYLTAIIRSRLGRAENCAFGGALVGLSSCGLMSFRPVRRNWCFAAAYHEVQTR